MFEDPLQNSLRLMESKNPSPSLENEKPTFEEKVYFLWRYLSGKVEHVERQYTMHEFLDSLCKCYLKTVERARLDGKIKPNEYPLMAFGDNEIVIFDDELDEIYKLITPSD